GSAEGQLYLGEQYEPILYWYYSLDVSNVSINDLDDLITRLAGVQTSLANGYGQGTQVDSIRLFGFNATLVSSGSPSSIEDFRDRVAVATIPADILALQILALILFFVSMITDLIAERQATAIAVLRSRGASRRQILGSFITQSL